MFGFKNIGKGAFTNCYDMLDGKVLLETVDPQKEAIACNWFPESKLLPTIEDAPAKYNSEKMRGGSYLQYYISPKYNKVRGYKQDLKPIDQKRYQELKKFYDNLPVPPDNKHYCLDVLRDNLNSAKMRPMLKELLNDCFDAMANYGSDIWFEISPRNIATDAKGNMILLDCFYMIGKLNDVRTK